MVSANDASFARASDCPARESLWPWAVLPLVAFALIVAISVGWLARDRSPLVFDPAAHMTSAVQFATQPGDYLRFEKQVYPPLGQMALGTVLRLDGYRVDTAIGVVGLAWVALLLASTFGIGRALYSARAGAIAAMLLALYPAIFIHARSAMLDLPLAAIATASIYALIRTRSFEDRRWTLTLGVLAGLGVLTKQTYIMIVAAPLLYVAVTSPNHRRAATGVAVAAAIAMVIALPWYLPRLGWFFGDYADIQNAYAASRGDPETLSAFGLSYYFIGTWHQTSFVFAILFVATLPLFLTGGRRGLPLCWWLGTVALTTLLDLKDTRFLIPALPAIALMTAQGLGRLRPQHVAIIVAAIACFGGVQLWAASFETGWLPRGEIVFNRAEREEHPQWFAQNYRLTLGNSSQADRSGWGIAGSLEGLDGRIAVVGNHVIFDAVNLPHTLQDARAGRPLTRVEPITCARRSQFKSFDAIVMQIGSADGVAADAYEACVVGLQEVRRLDLHVLNLLPTATSIVVLQPAR